MTDKTYPFISYSPPKLSNEEMLERSQSFFEMMDERRSVREFSDEPIDIEIINNIIRTASSAPSGAHKQPWTFCVISNKALKSKIRELAENEEKISYGGRMSDTWIQDLEPLGTNWVKEFIDVAPWIIVVMRKSYDFDDQGDKTNNYYVNESVGIASGFLLAAIHQAGLVSLTHTPSPMNFLIEALGRPKTKTLPINTCRIPC